MLCFFRPDIDRDYRHAAAHRHQHHARLEGRGLVAVKGDVSLWEHRDHLTAFQPRDDLAEGRHIGVLAVDADAAAPAENDARPLVHQLLADDEELAAVRHRAEQQHRVNEADVIRDQQRSAAYPLTRPVARVVQLRAEPKIRRRAGQAHKVVHQVLRREQLTFLGRFCHSTFSPVR